METHQALAIPGTLKGPLDKVCVSLRILEVDFPPPHLLPGTSSTGIILREGNHDGKGPNNLEINFVRDDKP